MNILITNVKSKSPCILRFKPYTMSIRKNVQPALIKGADDTVHRQQAENFVNLYDDNH